MGIETILLWCAAASVVLTMLARLLMQSTFKRHMNAFSHKGVTGAQAINAMLGQYGIQNVQLVSREGVYNDRYVQKLRALMVSSGAYAGRQIAATASALFETARVVQHERGLGALLLVRRWLYKSLNLLCYIAVPALLAVCVFGRFDLAGYPAAALVSGFLVAVLSLPLDWQAAKLAKQTIESLGMLEEQETRIAKSVLNACMLTFVASSYNALINILEIPKNLVARAFFQRPAEKAI